MWGGGCKGGGGGEGGVGGAGGGLGGAGVGGGGEEEGGRGIDPRQRKPSHSLGFSSNRLFPHILYAFMIQHM